jgi:hypothetical protein
MNYKRRMEMTISKIKIETLISLALGLFAVLFIQFAANRERLPGINDLGTSNYAGYQTVLFQENTTADPSAIYTGFP